MEASYHKTWSEHLQREMEYKTYGYAGRAVLVFPSQNQRFYEWEDNGMIDVLAPMIENGALRLICCDSIDEETWSLTEGNQHQRIALHERWFSYVVDELIPSERRGEETFIATGCSMGGYHSGLFFFRRPELFDTLFSMSGLFHADFFFPEFEDKLIYANSPLDFINDWRGNAALVERFRGKKIICCCGQGEYEGVTCASTHRLQQSLERIGISGHFDYWGYDVSHNFFWWRKQAVYFFSKIINAQYASAA